jgi:hypothetical protein
MLTLLLFFCKQYQDVNAQGRERRPNVIDMLKEAHGQVKNGELDVVM